MRNLKVGAKIILGFAIVIVMMIFSFAAVWISSTSTINNSQQVAAITELQNMVVELTGDFTEARAQANILYETHSDTAYEEFSGLTRRVSDVYGEINAFITEHSHLASFSKDIADTKSAFDQWAASVNELRAAQEARDDENRRYKSSYSNLYALAGNAIGSQLKMLDLQVVLESDYITLGERVELVAIANKIQSDILNIIINAVKLGYDYSDEALDTLIASMDKLEGTLPESTVGDVDSSADAAMGYVKTALAEFREAAVSYGEIAHIVNIDVEKAKPLGYLAGDIFFETDKKMSQMVTDVVTETKDNAGFYRMLIMIISVISAVLAVIIALFTANSITKPLRFLSGYIADVANTGDLSLVAKNRDQCEHFSKSSDEVGVTVLAANRLFELMEHQGDILKHIANKDISQTLTPRSENSTVELIAIELLDSLNDVMRSIRDSSAQVSVGAKQIADGAQNLAYSSAKQTEAIEHLGVSVSSVSEKSKDNSTLAVRAAALGESIRQNAEKGSSQMDRMVQAVKEIREASQNIGKVISVIDSIAFQTNILALNAAVEAARAGQHGKGFAVVAEEVRSLASKSAAAAHDTENLISNSIEKAELGANLAHETAESLAEIVEGIHESSQIVTAIAKSSEEQTAAITEIDRGITQVASVISQTSETSRESAATAQEMSSQSETLAELTTEFTLRDYGLKNPARLMLEE